MNVNSLHDASPESAGRNDFARGIERHLQKSSTLAEAIQKAAAEIENPMIKKIAGWMFADLEQGMQLSAVMGKYPALFGDDVLAKVRSIEADRTIENRLDYHDAVSTLFRSLAA